MVLRGEKNSCKFSEWRQPLHSAEIGKLYKVGQVWDKPGSSIEFSDVIVHSLRGVESVIPKSSTVIQKYSI